MLTYTPKTLFKSIWVRCKRNPALFTLLLLSAAYFLFYYFTDPARPANVFSMLGFHDTARYPLGWFGYNDQGDYLRLSHTLADFNFHQLHTTFLYGLGYPLVAVPFLWLGFNLDPFMIFDLFAFVFAVYATYKVASRWISPRAGFLAGFCIAFASPLVGYTDQPWNTTVCLVAISGILLVSLKTKPSKWHALVLGILVGWAFSARYIDALFLGLLALAALYRGSFAKLIRPSMYVFLGTLVFVIPVLYAQYRIFGSPLRTPYVLHMVKGEPGSDQQLTSYSLGKIPRTGESYLFGPRVVGLQDTDRGILAQMFWVLASIPGTYLLWQKTKNKLFVGSLVAFTFVVSLFYLSFRGTGADMLKFGLLHYFKMLWPGLTILAVAFFDHLLDRTVSLRPSKKA